VLSIISIVINAAARLILVVWGRVGRPAGAA
jgi:hypothetical protein